jgi:hypothetical protein
MPDSSFLLAQTAPDLLVDAIKDALKSHKPLSEILPLIERLKEGERSDGAGGRDLLGLAASSRRLDVIRPLLEAGCQPSDNAVLYEIGSYSMILEDQFETVKLFMEKNLGTLTTQGKGYLATGNTALHKAIAEANRSNIWEFVCLLVKPKMGLHIQNNLQKTPWQMLQQANKLDLLKEPSRGDIIEHAFKPLHDSITGGDLVGVASFLDAHPAYLESQIDEEQITPLQAAVRAGEFEIVKLIVNKGARLDAKNGFGSTALHEAIRCYQLDMVRFLIDQGASLEISNKGSYTPLHYAIASRQLDVVKLLLFSDEETSSLRATYPRGEYNKFWDLAKWTYKRKDIADLLLTARAARDAQSASESQAPTPSR